MRKHIINSRIGNKGESLTETLVAVLIAALGILLMVSMVTAASRLVKRSGTWFESNMTEKNAVEDESSLGKAKGTVVIKGTLDGTSGSDESDKDFSIEIKDNNFNEDAETYSENKKIWKYR